MEEHTKGRPIEREIQQTGGGYLYNAPLMYPECTFAIPDKILDTYLLFRSVLINTIFDSN